MPALPRGDLCRSASNRCVISPCICREPCTRYGELSAAQPIHYVYARKTQSHESVVRLEGNNRGVCCLLLALFALGPRFALALEWIFGHRIQHAFAHWWLPLLGLIFFPWTTLMYTIVWSAGGVHGANWIAVALGVVLDLFSYSSRRAQMMYRQRTAY